MLRTALLLLAFSSVYTPARKKALLSRVRGINWHWIRTDTLYEVAIRLLAISYASPKIIDSTCLALLAKRLITAEVTSGGPYKDTGDTIDITTNIAIAQLFIQLGHPLPNVQTFVEKHVLSKSTQTQSYITVWLLYWPNTLIKTPGIHYIAAGQQTLPTYGFAAQRALATVNSLEEPLRSKARYAWQSVNSANKNLEITHLSSFFAESLSHPPQHGTASLYHDLGEANFYAWMAYTIYDDFIDNTGKNVLLGVANTMHRRSLLLYSKHTPPSLNTWQYFDQMDEANAWELAHCRAAVDDNHITIHGLPEYTTLSVLAARASVHILGPIIITASNTDYAISKSIEAGLRHYLIAKQLSDDLHDWQADLSTGNLSPVVTHLLHKTGLHSGNFVIKDITPTLQQYFWHSGIQTITKRIVYHIRESKKYLLKDGFIANTDGPLFTQFITPLEMAATQAVRLQNEQRNFLDTYTSL